MARIPAEEIDRIKQQVSLERLVASHGIELRKHGAADLIGRCPFHDDKSPSLVVSPKKNLWHCLGACQAGGSVIDWVMKAKGVSFRHAVEVLRGDALPAAITKRAPLPGPIVPDAEDRELLAQVVSYYHETLKQSPEALGYLEERGIRSQEAIERFKLGFANRTLAYRLPPNGTKAGLDARERLQRLGVLRETGHEHFNGSLLVPIFGEQGEVLGMYGRKITAALRKGTPLHLYLPGPHRGLFNLDALQASKTVILCEALIDALTFYCAGFRNVTTSYGVEGFTAEHLAAFRRFGTQTVLIAYDRDDAGERAAQGLAEKLQAQGLTCYRVQFPKGMDANEYARKVTPAEKSLGVLLRNAQWLGKGQPPAVDLQAQARAAAALEAVVAEVRTPPPQRALPAPAGPAAAPPSSPAVPAGENDRAAKEEAAPAGAAAQDELVLSFGERRYRIRGLSKNLGHESLKVNLLAAKGESVHVDTLDLYSARQRAAFVKQAAAELGSQEDTLKRDVGQVLLRLEELREQQIKEALEPKAGEVALSPEEQAEALGLLRDPRLLQRILADFEACGVVGEEQNKLLGYLAAVSRKLEEPLAVIVQSSSAAGKTSLMEAVLAFMPEEERVKYSAMTGQSLFYMGETNLKHKILAIVEEQGAERASYALKLLQSEGELTIASTGKDPQTGRLVTHEYRVEGPVMIFLTTTALEIDEELLNRCLVLAVDEDREQTRAIHRLQREKQTLEGLLARQARPALLRTHQNAQRLLRPLLVANPYARQLTFLDDRTRTRRDHVKYLTLIRTIALLHQYQRETKTVEHRGELVPYIEVTLQDVAVANRLAHQTLGRSLDELGPQTRRLLVALDAMVRELEQAQGLPRAELRFSRRAVREKTGWSYDQVRVHLERLVALEYVLAHHGGRGQSFEYELLYDGKGQDGKPFVTGLIDVESLRAPSTTAGLGGREAEFGGGLGVHLAPIGPPLGGVWDSLPTAPEAAIPAFGAQTAENAHLDAASSGSRTRGGNGAAGAPLALGPGAH
jgi:DNA primase catalytic core